MLSEKEEPGHGGFDEEKWTIADGLRPALEKSKVRFDSHSGSFGFHRAGKVRLLRCPGQGAGSVFFKRPSH